LLLAACGPGAVTEEPTSEPEETSEQATAEPVEEETEEEEPLKFAVITSGPRDDNSWNEAAWNGVQALEEQGIETAFSERIAEGDELRILREYVDQGFDIIVAHGFGYQDGVFEVAGENPDVNFAWAGGINRTAENVADYDQPFYQGAYVVGVVAGHMTESDVLGSLSGFDIPVCHSMGEAFLAGARSANPDVTLIRTAAGSWEDVAASKEAALAQAEAGVDYWMECGEGPALGAIEAAKEVGGYTTGYVGDMSENGPETIVASIVWNLEPLFSKMVEQTRNGTFANTYYSMGLADGSGSLVIEYNEGLADEIPDEAREAADAALEGIIEGDIEVPYLPEGELGEGETGSEAEGVDLSEGSLALITSGPRDDNSWNEAAWNAVQALEEQGVETAFSERIAEGDELRILREYVDQGFDMIVAHGFGYQDGVFEVAEENPDVNFAWAGGINRTAENVADYDQPFYQGAYVAGVVAGHMTESDVLGSLSGFDIPVCHSMGEAFLAGARSVNPDVTLIRTAAGSWEDVAASKEAALAQAEAGVDFWIECGEGPALGAIEAAKEVGGYTTGYVGDMSENGPETVVVSIVWNLEPLFTKMLEQTLDGTFDNPYYSMGVADGSGSLVIEYNEGLADEIPDEAREAADAALEGIIAGEIEVPYLPEGELGE
jgi:simple sugar transport system substrate-binding protein/basic membrane protein A